MKSCQWGLTRSSSYGLLGNSPWRTPAFWATKFWVFAGNFQFTGSSLSILKVAFFFLFFFCSYCLTLSHRVYKTGLQSRNMGYFIWIIVHSFIVYIFRSQMVVIALLICWHTCKIQIFRSCANAPLNTHATFRVVTPKTASYQKRMSLKYARPPRNHCC